jgi:hypothetical protein
MADWNFSGENLFLMHHYMKIDTMFGCQINSYSGEEDSNCLEIDRYQVMKIE